MIQALSKWRGSENKADDALSKIPTSAQLLALAYSIISSDYVQLIMNSCKVDAERLKSKSIPLLIPKLAWSKISVDFIEGFPSSNGTTIIFVLVDKLRKTLAAREAMIQLPQFHLERAQQRMKAIDDAKRTDREFELKKHKGPVPNATVVLPQCNTEGEMVSVHVAILDRKLGKVGFWTFNWMLEDKHCLKGKALLVIVGGVMDSGGWGYCTECESDEGEFNQVVVEDDERISGFGEVIIHLEDLPRFEDLTLVGHLDRSSGFGKNGTNVVSRSVVDVKKKSRRSRRSSRSRHGNQKKVLETTINEVDVQEEQLPQTNATYGMLVGPFGSIEDSVFEWSLSKRPGTCDMSSQFARLVWSRKSVLIFHELSMTGAPLSMMELASELLSCGATVSIVALSRKGKELAR
ncbi:UDP-glycosyltransferase superfamily protein, partial [Tanacetum coccineum]